MRQPAAAPAGVAEGRHRSDREDPAWQRLARQRARMRHWPGVLSVWPGAGLELKGEAERAARDLGSLF